VRAEADGPAAAMGAWPFFWGCRDGAARELWRGSVAALGPPYSCQDGVEESARSISESRAGS